MFNQYFYFDLCRLDIFFSFKLNAQSDIDKILKGGEILVNEIVLVNKEVYKKGEYKFNEEITITVKQE